MAKILILSTYFRSDIKTVYINIFYYDHFTSQTTKIFLKDIKTAGEEVVLLSQMKGNQK